MATRRLKGALFGGLTAIFPWIVVLATPRLAGWTSVLPPIFAIESKAGEKTADLLSTLSNSLNAMAVALIIGTFVLLRERRGAVQGFATWLLAVWALAMAASSLYAGYRFQLGMAEQLSIFHLDMARVVDRLEWQAVSLLIGLSPLIVLAVRQLREPANEAPAPRRRPPRYPAPARRAKAVRR